MNELLIKLLYAVIISVVPILTKFLTDYIKNLKFKIESEMQNKYIDEVKNIISDIVLSVNQTFVERLKKEGAFTKEAQEEAYKMAYATALILVQGKAKEVITNVYSDFDTFLETQIESYVNMYKIEPHKDGD